MFVILHLLFYHSKNNNLGIQIGTRIR
ncbi:transcriptional regulator, partial [Campylobacter jejuni]|nr:transcriptional regulator [Campylobacter jejuni]